MCVTFFSVQATPLHAFAATMYLVDLNMFFLPKLSSASFRESTGETVRCAGSSAAVVAHLIGI